MSRFMSRTVLSLLTATLLAGSVAIAASNAPSAGGPPPSGAEPAKKRSLPADGRDKDRSLPASGGSERPQSLPANGKAEPSLRWDGLDPNLVRSRALANPSLHLTFASPLCGLSPAGELKR